MDDKQKKLELQRCLDKHDPKTRVKRYVALYDEHVAPIINSHFGFELQAVEGVGEMLSEMLDLKSGVDRAFADQNGVKLVAIRFSFTRDCKNCPVKDEGWWPTFTFRKKELEKRLYCKKRKYLYPHVSIEISFDNDLKKAMAIRYADYDDLLDATDESYWSIGEYGEFMVVHDRLIEKVRRWHHATGWDGGPLF